MTVEANFSEQPDAVALARRFTEEVLGGVPGPIAHEIVLMVSELATNAVVHAATTFRLSIERTDKLVRVEVVDGGGGHALLRSPSNRDCHGRGLQLVDTLSDQWGTTEGGDDGKKVWFVRNLVTAGPAGATRRVSVRNVRQRWLRGSGPSAPPTSGRRSWSTCPWAV